MTWTTPDPCNHPIQAAMGEVIEKLGKRDPTLLPNLRSDNDLVLASDYSGEHRASKYHVITFLLADRPGVLETWDSARREIRSRFLPHRERHEFKSLGDMQRQKALMPFLDASALINGIVFSVAIDKSIATSMLGFKFPDVISMKRKVLSKLVRISLFGSILLAGLGRIGQSVKWITDNDDVMSNEVVQDDACKVFSSVLDHCCPFELADFSIGIAGLFDDDLRAEDLCSIPDLVGGATSELLNAIPAGLIPKYANLCTPAFGKRSTKTYLINAWFGGLRGPLKKLFFLLRPDEQGNIRVSFATPTVSVAAPYTNQLWYPPDRGWRQTWRTQ